MVAESPEKLMSIIKPSVGRVVLYRPAPGENICKPDDGAPLAAVVARVWNDHVVNLGVFDANGVSVGRTSVALRQPGEPVPAIGSYAEWMPYQIGQAAKTEALQAQVECKQYGDGATATGVAPLPEVSPTVAGDVV
jgi:hypothetical protein